MEASHRNWDPEVESPATIAVIGGGPTGIEAALYARFLGYYVELFESHRVAGHVTAWGDESSGLTFRDATSSLGRAALRTQDPDRALGGMDRPITLGEWGEEYLIPLAKTDLVYDSVRAYSKVLSISRVATGEGLKWMSPQERANDQFRILVHTHPRGEWIAMADVILDCSGWSFHAMGLGPGGGIALGELANRSEVLSRIPDVSTIAGCRHWVLWGATPEASAAARRFASLGPQHPDLRLTWLVPYAAVGDPLVEEAVRQLQMGLSKSALVPCQGIDALTPLPGSGWDIRVSQENESSVQVQCDSIISLPQPVRDLTWLRGLEQTQRINWQAEASCDNADWPGWKNATKEPHYYLLGSKLHDERTSRTSETIQGMHREIRDVFALLGGRKNLDLYSDFANREGRS